MSGAMRAHDWTQSPLGMPHDWPKTLQVIVNLTLESAQPMFVAWGPERTLVYNDAYIPLLGRKHPQALGRPFFSVWREAIPEVGPLVDRVFQGESLVMDDISLVLDRNEGPQEAHFAFSYTPVRDDAGRVARLFCACQDTTDSFRLRQVDRQSNARLAKLFEAAPSFMAMLEGPEHRIVLANTRYMHLVGYRQVLGLTVAEALPDAVAQGYLELLDSVFQSGKPSSSIGAKYAVQPGPSALVSDRFVDFVFQPIPDESGSVTGIFVEGTDVTERVLAEQALKQTESKLREANATLAAGIEQRTAQLLAREALIRTFYEHSSECHAVLKRAAAPRGHRTQHRRGLGGRGWAQFEQPIAGLFGNRRAIPLRTAAR